MKHILDFGLVGSCHEAGMNSTQEKKNEWVKNVFAFSDLAVHGKTLKIIERGQLSVPHALDGALIIP